MKYCECPYCKRAVASFWSLGNTAYVFNTQKKCPHCMGRIKMNLRSYLLTIPIGGFSFIIVFAISYFILKDISTVVFFLLFAFVYSVFFIQIIVYSYYFCFRLFLPKDDVGEHMKKVPSYLR